MKLHLSDGRIETPDLSEKIALLWGAHHKGKNFFLLQAESFREYAEWIFASFATPVTVVPVSSSLPPAALQEFQAQLPPGQVIRKEELSERGEIPKNFQKSLDDLWVVIFTSGSSGFPKGVALSGAQLSSIHLASVDSALSYWRFQRTVSGPFSRFANSYVFRKSRGYFG